MNLEIMKAFLRTLSETGKRILRVSLIVSATALVIGQPEFTDMWKVPMPFGVFCWLVGVIAESQRLKLTEMHPEL